MTALAVASWRAAVMGRWAARILGTLLVLFFLFFIVGEGLPAPSELSSVEKLQFAGLAAILAGLLLAWKWEGLGGVLGVAGFLLMAAASRSSLRVLLFWLPAAVAGVHVLCWTRLRAGAPAGLVGWQVNRGLLAGFWVAVAVFLLLTVNEVFGQPPLMTPALHPAADLAGNWNAGPGQLPVMLEIHVDGTVTGQILSAPIAGARIRYGRSWFAKMMHWGADYVIAGRMAQEVRLSERGRGTGFS